MESATNQVGSLVEFFWYAPIAYVLLASAVLWFAVASALLSLVEKWAAERPVGGRFNMKPPFWGVIFASLALIGVFLAASYYQKSKTIKETRAGIVHFMVESGWRAVNFEKVRANINSDYSNDLLLAAGTDNPMLTLEPFGSLSLKLNGPVLCKIKHAEDSLAHLIVSAATQKGNSTGPCKNLLFREIDESVLRGSSQLFNITTLLDYPESFVIYYETGSKNVYSVDVYLNPNLLAPGPLPFRGSNICNLEGR